MTQRDLSASAKQSSVDGSLRCSSHCGICGARAPRIYKRHAGFIAPSEFDVYQCERCDTTFASFEVAEPTLYDAIYSRAHLLPGYDRYKRYAAGVAQADDPLAWLAEQEDVYWAVKQALTNHLPPLVGSRYRVLEVGCGMGYLTSALDSAGYEVLGVDLSVRAVAAASWQFGDLFKAGDASSEEVTGGDYDAVIATELIEHLEDPVDFVRAMTRKLRPGGCLILTTPNRDIYPRTLAWHTDPAPVHRWWLSSTSLRFVAQLSSCDVRFIDFSGFYRRSKRASPVSSKPQSLAADGSPIFRDGAVNTFARWLMRCWPALARPLAMAFLSRLAIQRIADEVMRQSLSYCVVLHPVASAESEGSAGGYPL